MTTTLSRNRWFTNYNAQGFHRARLFCFPFSGGGSPVFRGWTGALPEVEIVAALLPGRERRLAEPPVRELRDLVDSLVSAMEPMLDRPFALFGHSMGALIAYEVARRLEALRLPLPIRLFASAFRSPERPNPSRPIHHLPDREFVEELRRYGGTPEGILENPEMLALVLPTLKADFRLHEVYVHPFRLPLDCPITAFAGAQDHVVPPAEMQGWERHGRRGHRGHRLMVFPGGHFFLQDSRNQLLAEVARDLSADLY